MQPENHRTACRINSRDGRTPGTWCVRSIAGGVCVQEAAVAVCSLKVFLWVISASDDLTVSRETEHFHQRQGNHFIMVANNHYMSSQDSSEDQLITFIKHTESTKCHRVLNIIIKNTLTNGKGGWVRNRALKHSKSHTGNNYYWILIFTPQNVISAYTAFVRPDRSCREESSAWRTDQQERILKKKKMIDHYLHYNKQQPNLWRLFLGWEGRELRQTSSSNHLKFPDWKTYEYSQVHQFSKKGTNVIATLITLRNSQLFFSELRIKNPSHSAKILKSAGAEVRNKRSWQNPEQNFRGTLNLTITPYFLSSAVQHWAC